jgi:hypothetical protein
MTANDKAKDLVWNFYEVPSNEYDYGMNWEMAKQCARLAVNEIIKALRSDLPEVGKGKGYWSDVRREIESI